MVFESCRPRAKVVLVVPMEIILPMLLVPVAAWAFLTLLAVGIAHGNGKMESEEFPFSKPTAKLVRKVDGKTPAPEQTTVKSETVVKTSEKIVVSSQGLSETTVCSQCNAKIAAILLRNSNCGSGSRNHARTQSAHILVVLDHNRQHRRYGYDGGISMEIKRKALCVRSLQKAENSFQRIGDSRRKKKRPFVATHVTSRNAPAVTASMISEPKL